MQTIVKFHLLFTPFGSNKDYKHVNREIVSRIVIWKTNAVKFYDITAGNSTSGTRKLSPRLLGNTSVDVSVRVWPAEVGVCQLQ